MEILHHYRNGNCDVHLYADGTKKRHYDNDAKPIHPESLDVKVTNYCDAGCSFCHEKSTRSGLHAELNKLCEVLSVLPAGVEIAIGGGNPLSHPELLTFLQKLKSQGLVVNITVNQKHLKPYKDLILKLIADKLVYGVGISYSSRRYLEDILPIMQATNHIVFHVIMGINPVNDVDELYDFCLRNNANCKVLVLGYKHFGFGIDYYLKNKNIEDNKYRWYVELAAKFKTPKLVLSFDNLAISQLNLKRYFTDDAWSRFFMGEDFIFTMYIDAVNQHYAPSSTSPVRIPFSKLGLLDFFQTKPKE